jgi:hypothetical protein
MQLKLIDDLPYAEVTIDYQDEKIKVDQMRVDTGSASTIFSSDVVDKIGITPQPEDPFTYYPGSWGRGSCFQPQGG